MTEIDLSNINIDLTYQDGLRLSELYGQMGTIEYDLAHLSMSSILYTILLCLIALAPYFIVMSSALTEYRRDKLLTGLIDENRYGHLCIGIVAMYFVICALIHLGIMEIMEYELNRELVDVQIQIDTILSKYEQGGI